MDGRDPVATSLGRLVELGDLAGAVTVVWRGGAEIQSACVGWRDVEARTPITRDTIFRIASMTKPVTCLAALTLMEEGAFALDTPITEVAPEFARMRVLRDPNGPLDATDPAERPITFGDLLTHRSGLTYGDFHAGPIRQAHDAALGASIDSHLTPDAWIAGLAGLPLIDQPGAGFHYGHSTDLLGQLIARLDGAPLGEVLARRVFRPLGMADTGFTVPREKRNRQMPIYGFDAADKLAKRDTYPGGAALAERPESYTYVSGGQGLWSTIDDYLAFARLFLGGGAVDGVRLLRPETLAEMTANHLTDAQRDAATMFGQKMFAGHGFGLGVAVMLDPARATASHCGGGAGAVGWPGAFGGWWTADPAADTAMILLTHNMVELEQMARGVGLGGFMAGAELQAAAKLL